MQYCLHDVEVATLRDRVKEAASNKLASFRQSRRRREQNRVQQVTLTATDIHDTTELAEVVGFESRFGFKARVACHRSIENGLLFRMIHPIGPGIYSMGESACAVARFDAVEQVTPGLPLAGGSDPFGVVTGRARRVARQARAQGGEIEFLAAGLMKHTDRSQSAE